VAATALGLGPTELDAALRSGRALTELAPLREAGYRFLMQALAARGETPAALAVYEQLRTTLRDELGVAAGPATQALYHDLLAVT
jgi:DNA-binding SARP family transcriptional activator